MDSDHLLILCTAPSAEVAERIGRGLVEARLAACVNAMPGLRSFYRWRGEIAADDEVQLFIKTRLARFADVERYIKANHPYEVPEVIAVPVVAASQSYLGWLDAETSDG